MRIEHIGDSRTVTTRLIRCFRIANSCGRSFLFYTTFLTLSLARPIWQSHAAAGCLHQQLLLVQLRPFAEVQGLAGLYCQCPWYYLRPDHFCNCLALSRLHLSFSIVKNLLLVMAIIPLKVTSMKPKTYYR